MSQAAPSRYSPRPRNSSSATPLCCANCCADDLAPAWARIARAVAAVAVIGVTGPRRGPDRTRAGIRRRHGLDIGHAGRVMPLVALVMIGIRRAHACQ